MGAGHQKDQGTNRGLEFSSMYPDLWGGKRGAEIKSFCHCQFTQSCLHYDCKRTHPGWALLNLQEAFAGTLIYNPWVRSTGNPELAIGVWNGEQSCGTVSLVGYDTNCKVNSFKIELNFSTYIHLMCGEWRIHWLRKKQTSGVKSVVDRNSSGGKHCHKRRGIKELRGQDIQRITYDKTRLISSRIKTGVYGRELN